MAQGAQFEDGLRTGKSPAGAGDVHTVLDEMAAGAFDHAGGDGPALPQGGSIVEVGTLVVQVVGTGVRAVAFLPVEMKSGGLAADTSSDNGSLTGENSPGLLQDPALGRRITLGEETPGRCQRYSSTWMKSMMMCRSTERAWACALMQSI